tara:strand:- start:624 stop:884 length:261 start_codon:yes stop_codon:yes gene_type:complete
MKSSTVKMVRQATKKHMALLSTSYQNTQAYTIETYVNVKRVIKIQAFNEDHAIKRALAKEEDRVVWKNLGYEFVDCDCDVVGEQLK